MLVLAFTFSFHLSLMCLLLHLKHHGVVLNNPYPLTVF